MGWPSAPDYQAVVQNPAFFFKDADLKTTQAQSNRLGLPILATGQNACVFKMLGAHRQYAVRCFLKPVTDHKRRYELLSEWLNFLRIPQLVEFEYLEEGILVSGQWYPIVKMDWVEGDALDVFLERHLSKPETLEELLSRWVGAMASLKGARMAHGDLQQGNVLVHDIGRDIELRLVDYDGMFVPKLRGKQAPELGHPDFQHPRRSVSDFNENLDDFPGLVVYLSIRALRTDPGLWRQFYNQRNLVFRQADFQNPSTSVLFNQLKKNDDSGVRELASRLEQYCRTPLSAVPDFRESVEHLPQLPTVAKATPPVSAPTAKTPKPTRPPGAPVLPGPKIPKKKMTTTTTPTSPPLQPPKPTPPHQTNRWLSTSGATGLAFIAAYVAGSPVSLWAAVAALAVFFAFAQRFPGRWGQSFRRVDWRWISGATVILAWIGSATLPQITNAAGVAVPLGLACWYSYPWLERRAWPFLHRISWPVLRQSFVVIWERRQVIVPTVLISAVVITGVKYGPALGKWVQTLSLRGGSVQPLPQPPPPPPGTGFAIVTFDSDPVGAEILAADGKTKLGRAGQPIQVPPGTHEFIVAKPPTHASERVYITVTAGELQTLPVKLQPLPAKLEVTSNPTGATVSIDGIELGVTPLERELTGFGVRRLRIELNGKVRTRTVRISPGKLTRADIDIVGSSGLLTISSVPPGATVLLNGQPKGETPLARMSLEPGVYQLRVVHQGYPPVRRKVQISEGKGQVITVRFTTPAAAKGKLVIRGPLGAKVLIDGTLRGTITSASGLVLQVREGLRSVEVRTANGSWGASISITRNQERHVDVPLTVVPKTTGTLVIVGPIGARVFVDGMLRGTITSSRGLTLQLAPGLRSIEVRMSGSTWSATVPIEANSRRRLEVPSP